MSQNSCALCKAFINERQSFVGYRCEYLCASLQYDEQFGWQWWDELEDCWVSVGLCPNWESKCAVQ